MEHLLIRKVWKALNTGFSGQLHLTIPTDNPEGIDAGDLVSIKLFRPTIKNGKCSKCHKPYMEHKIKELEKCELLG